MADPLGSTPGIIVGVGVGAAAAAALEPAVELPRQKAWSDNPNRELDPGTMARLAAQGGVSLGLARAAAKREGYDQDKLDALVYLAQTVPAVSEAITLWRRGHLSDALFTHVLTKAGLDTRYVQPTMDAAHDERLAPAQIALGVVRGILQSDGLLVKDLDLSAGNVPRYPVSSIDPVAEAATWGIDRERLRVMVGEIGLPMATIMAANALFRGILTQTDYNAAVSEGDVRPEWGEAIKEVSRQILTTGQYVEGHLRGWTDLPAMYANTAKHGMSQADTDLLFKISGRPITIKQITTGLARGGTYPSTYDDVPEPYRKSLQESNIRPEWASLDYANRYTMPSAFVVRTLLTDHVLTAAQGEEIFLKSGWEPPLAALVADHYAAKTSTGGQTHLQKAQNQLWTTAHRSFIAEESDDAAARTALATAGVNPTEIDGVLTLWQAERDLIRKQLTPAQIKKAYLKGSVNAATGNPWTQDEALAALIERGYSPTDAQSFLNIV